MATLRDKHILIGGKWILKPVHNIGDRVRVINNPGYYSQVSKGQTYTVADTRLQTQGMVFDEENSEYVQTYSQKVSVGNGSWYTSKNFQNLTQEAKPVLQIEANRPAIVKEFVEHAKDGEVKREYIGEAKEFASQSLARLYCQHEITNSIRKDNLYRRFAIFVEQSVAQAKEPQIEFK
jgi:hypothetical protein